MNSSLNNTDIVTHAVVLQGKYTNSLDYVAISLRSQALEGSMGTRDRA